MAENLIILDTIDGKTYYDYNGILCGFEITYDICNNMGFTDPENLTVYDKNIIMEKSHSPDNKCNEEEISLLINNNFKIFSKYEQRKRPGNNKY